MNDGQSMLDLKNATIPSAAFGQWTSLFAGNSNCWQEQSHFVDMKRRIIKFWKENKVIQRRQSREKCGTTIVQVEGW